MRQIVFATLLFHIDFLYMHLINNISRLKYKLEYPIKQIHCISQF